MATPLQPVRGTRDILGDDAARHAFVVETARRVTSLYGFSEWQTPIFEDTRVFSRTLGETSDVVTKEMYTFKDRGDDSITLRPEGTAGVCRALITAGLTQTLPQKVFYAGPMFRYERPQKGRYRQFHQIGVELLGPSSPLADAEVIACGWKVLQELGVSQDVVLNLNTLGDSKSRAKYRDALVSYFNSHASDLSEESKLRLIKNPLRILDSKDEGDKELCSNAPIIDEHLSEEAENHYIELKRYLDILGVAFTPNPRIVRGLDYYNHTAFEFVTNALGAQGTVLAGGRYDGLVEQMGGPSVPGVGWAAGVDRLALMLKDSKTKPSVIFVAHDDIPDTKALTVLKMVRDSGVSCEVGYVKSAKRNMDKALKSDFRLLILMVPDLLVKGQVAIQDLESIRNKTDDRSQFRSIVSIDDLVSTLKFLIKSLWNNDSLLMFSERLQLTSEQ